MHSHSQLNDPGQFNKESAGSGCLEESILLDHGYLHEDLIPSYDLVVVIVIVVGVVWSGDACVQSCGSRIIRARILLVPIQKRFHKKTSY